MVDSDEYQESKQDLVAAQQAVPLHPLGRRPRCCPRPGAAAGVKSRGVPSHYAGPLVVGASSRTAWSAGRRTTAARTTCRACGLSVSQGRLARFPAAVTCSASCSKGAPPHAAGVV